MSRLHPLASVDEAVAWLRARVTGQLQTDSRLIQPGDGFIAWPGAATDGRAHVGDAIARGAAACLVEREGAEPLREFMLRNSKVEQRDFFVRTAKRLLGPDLSAGMTERDFMVLMPAFMVSELTAAFQIGFLLYLPFVVIDLIVSNILLAMGMMMVSPVTISLPLKLFLFVMLDGWSRLIQSLILSYV